MFDLLVIVNNKHTNYFCHCVHWTQIVHQDSRNQTFKYCDALWNIDYEGWLISAFSSWIHCIWNPWINHVSILFWKLFQNAENGVTFVGIPSKRFLIYFNTTFTTPERPWKMSNFIWLTLKSTSSVPKCDTPKFSSATHLLSKLSL